ncbi:MAG TPA: ABC transporter ATP-binding protein [Candidatus Saccharimonadales bacterium]|nr:ABC transporter ATP-binding protein [Candidatus Saccharimonadales bacterium]
MSKSTPPTATKLALRRYFQQIWRVRAFSLPGLILPGIANIFTTYVTPLIVAAVITHFGNHTPTLHEALPYLFWFAGAWFGGELIWRAAFLFLSQADAKAMRNLYIDGLNELSHKDLGFFHDNFAGSLTKKTIAYGRNFESFLDTMAFNVFAYVLPLLFASIILWRFSPWLVVALIGLIGIAGVVIIPLTRKRKKYVDERETASNVMAGHVADVIGNMDAVQAFAHEDFEREHHNKNVTDYMNKALRSWNFHTLHIDLAISPIYVLINVVGLALAITLSNDTSTVAKIFVTFNYFGSATFILWQFNRTYRNLENAISEAAQFTELLLTEPKISEAASPKEMHVTKGEITFEKVHFAYDNTDGTPLFEEFNLHIAPGEKLALVGHSGGGKTTITKLLLRFNDITSGKLCIDGQDIRNAKIADVRHAIAYVPQEPAMFHRSIRENIRYGDLTASDEAVVAAAKKANAHDFISALPDGYDTLVGERGVKLSGGQRQRIAIARAILKNAPILVLDEATSALDSESEKLIQEALWQLMEGRTAIVVAHRLSTIQKMDRIVVLENGAIHEQGSHRELLKKDGIYAKLWAHQSGGFIEE